MMNVYRLATAIATLLLCACSADGGDDNSINNSTIINGDVITNVDDSGSSSGDSGTGNSSENEGATDGGASGADSPIGSDDSTGNSDNPAPTDIAGDTDLTLSFLWSLPFGNNRVQGSPLISDAELIISGGNSTSSASAQIKAFSTSGLPQSWPLNPDSSAREIRAYAEVAGDPNGNIYAMRLINDDGETVRLVTRTATGQQLPLYQGGGGQFRSAPSIDVNGRVVFVNGVNEVAIRELDGSVSVLNSVSGIGTMRSKPAISNANTAYFSVESEVGLVGVELDSGMTSVCAGALPSWSSPAIAGNGNVIMGTTSGRIMACNSSMSTVWYYPDGDEDNANALGCNSMDNEDGVDGNVTGSPLIDAADNIYIRSNNGFIYALNAAGKIRWCHDTGVTQGVNSIAGTPVLTSNGYLIFVDENGVSALNKETGELVKRLADSRILPALRGAVETPTITPSGLLVYRVATNLVAIETNTTLDDSAFWPKWGADLRNSGLQR